MSVARSVFAVPRQKQMMNLPAGRMGFHHGWREKTGNGVRRNNPIGQGRLGKTGEQLVRERGGRQYDKLLQEQAVR